MAAAVINLYIEQGTDWTHKFKFWQDAEKTEPTDFSGCTGKCQFCDSDGCTVAEPIVTLPGDGYIVISIDKATSSALILNGIGYEQTSEFYYDLEITDPLGKTFRKANGKVEMSPEVTK